MDGKEEQGFVHAQAGKLRRGVQLHESLRSLAGKEDFLLQPGQPVAMPEQFFCLQEFPSDLDKVSGRPHPQFRDVLFCPIAP